jgi:hypothetical protein
MLYGLEGIVLNTTSMQRLETAHRTLLKEIQALPKRTATPAIHILTGALPIEAEVDRRKLLMLPTLAENPMMTRILHRQMAIKDHKASSWVMDIQAKLYKYDLPHLPYVIENQPSKEIWKKQVDKAISKFWTNALELEADKKSTLRFLNKSFSPSKAHQVWKHASNTVADVRKSTYKARMLTGVYILQATRAAFNQTSNRTCPMCSGDDEDMVHFISTCPTLDSVRTPLMNRMLESIPRVYADHPHNWNDEMITQLTLDSSHHKIAEILPNVASYIPLIEKQARLLTFALHKARVLHLDEEIQSKNKYQKKGKPKKSTAPQVKLILEHA